MTPPSVKPVDVMALADDIMKLLVRSNRKASSIAELSDTFMTPDRSFVTSRTSVVGPTGTTVHAHTALKPMHSVVS